MEKFVINLQLLIVVQMHQIFQDDQTRVFVEGWQSLLLIELINDFSRNVLKLQKRANQTCEIQGLKSREILHDLFLHLF